MKTLSLWGLPVLSSVVQAAPFDHRHEAWNTLLERHVHWVRAGGQARSITRPWPASAGLWIPIWPSCRRSVPPNSMADHATSDWPF